MRTIQIDCARGFRGGERQVIELARGLKRRGHPTLVVARPKAPLCTRAREAGLEVAELPMRGSWDPRSRRRVGDIAREFRADLVHAHDALSLRLALSIRNRLSVPVVLSRRVDFPVSRLGRAAYRSVDLILAVSSAVERVLAECGIGGPSVRVVHDGVDVASVRSISEVDPGIVRRRLGLPDDAVCIGNFASLTDHKGQRYLIDAMVPLVERFPKLVLLIAGEGELRSALEAQIDTLGLQENVRLLGFVSEVRELFAVLSVFVMSSRLEGLGSVVLEAMAASTPLVVTDAGGLVETVEGDVSGLVVPREDPVALAEAVGRLLDDDDLRRRLADAGHERVLTRFSSEHMIDASINSYRELIE